MKIIYILFLIFFGFAAGYYTGFFRYKDRIAGGLDDKVLLVNSSEVVDEHRTIVRSSKNTDIISAENLSQVDLLELKQLPLEDRYAKVHHLLMSQIKSDPAIAYRWMLANKDSFSEDEFLSFRSDILTSWGHSYPESASDVLDTLDTVELRDTLARALAKGWADRNVNQAFRWLENLNESSVSDEVLMRSYAIIMMKYAEVDPVANAGIVAGLESESLQNELLHSTVSEYAKKDYAGALNWVLELDRIELRDTGIRNLLLTVNENEALPLLSKVVGEESNLSTQVLADTFSLLARISPLEAAGRIADISTNKQAVVTSALISSWAAEDLSSAESWLANQANTGLFEAGTESIVNSIAYKTPIKALEWAGSITNVDKRLELMSHVIDGAIDSDLNNIQSYLGSSSMDVNEVQILQSMIIRRITNANAALAIPE